MHTYGMRPFAKPFLFLPVLALLSCGGGGSSGGTISTPTSTGVILSASETSLTFSGAQFGDPPPSQRIDLTFDPDVVGLIRSEIAGSAQSEFGDIFTASSDTSQAFFNVRPIFTDVEGGTYEDVLTLTPTLRAGGEGPPVTIDLTLVQAPTQPITASLNDPTEGIVVVTEGGPSIRVAATITTGNTIRWEVQPFRFTADDVDVLAGDPIQGVGSEQIDLIITPTPTLIEGLSSGFTELAFVNIQDLDHPGNFTEIGVEISLAE